MFKNRDICFNNCVLHDNKIWYVSINGYLMNLDLESRQVSYVEPERLEDWGKHPVTDDMFVLDNSVYWVDQYGKGLHEYNIKLQKYYQYKLPKMDMVEWGCFAGIYRYERKLFLFPKSTSYHLEFDLLERQLIRCPQACQNTEVKISSVKKDNWIYLFERKKNKAVKFNLESREYAYVDVPGEIAEAIHIVECQNRFYILSQNGTVYLWNEEEGDIKEIYTGRHDEQEFGRIVVTKSKLFLLPGLGKRILIVNLQNHVISEQEQYPHDFDMEYCDLNWGKYFGIFKDTDYIWFANRKTNYMLRINRITENIEWIKIIPPSIEPVWWDLCEKMRKIDLDEKTYGLELLFEIKQKQKAWNREGSRVGRSIWEAVKQNWRE